MRRPGTIRYLGELYCALTIDANDIDIEAVIDTIESPARLWERHGTHHRLYILEVTEGLSGREQLEAIGEFLDIPVHPDDEVAWNELRAVAADLGDDLTAMLREFGYPGDLRLKGDGDEGGRIPGDPYCLWLFVDDEEFRATYGDGYRTREVTR